MIWKLCMKYNAVFVCMYYVYFKLDVSLCSIKYLYKKKKIFLLKTIKLFNYIILLFGKNYRVFKKENGSSVGQIEIFSKSTRIIKTLHLPAAKLHNSTTVVTSSYYTIRTKPRTCSFRLQNHILDAERRV